MRRWVDRLRRDPRLFGGLGTAIFMAAISLYWLASNGWMVRSSYDTSHRLFVPFHQTWPTNPPVIIVYIDLDSHRREHQIPSGLWDRNLHAKLLRRLTQAGAQRVVFDILFSDSRSPASDKAFRESIEASGRTILSGELVESSQLRGDVAAVETQQVKGPWSEFQRAAAGWGLAELANDGDFIVRRLYPGFLEAGSSSSSFQARPSLSIAALQPTNLLEAMTPKRWVRYYGAPMTLPHVTYSGALREVEVPDEVFRDRIVIIGARPMAGGFAERRDELRNPLREWGQPDQFMPAVEMHATQILNLLRDDWLRRLPMGWESIILISSAGLLAALLFSRRPLPAAGWAFAAEGVVLLTAGWAFEARNSWFPWMIVAGGQIPAILSGSVILQSLEWYRQKRRFEAERRRAEAKIREQAALIDKAQDAILTRTLDGLLLYANPSAAHLYGLTATELMADGAWGKLAALDADKLATAEQEVRAVGEWSGELAQKNARGEPLIVESRWTLIRDQQDEPVSILLINTDVTEKKRLAEQFLRVQRMETMGSLAGGIAHDLNNALAPVLMGIQLLQRRTSQEEDLRMLKLMETNTLRGAGMVRQVLLFSRGQSEDRQPLSMEPLIREIETIVCETFPAGVHVDVMAQGDLWPVLGNSTQLHQVLLNLCINARDAMPDGGHITLVAENAELGAEELTDLPELRPGRYVLLLVSDTGSGIPAEVRQRLFEPFFTTKAAGKGTGLGLSTSQNIVRQHGGGLRVESIPGSGTTFEIYLPATTETAAKPNPVRPTPVPGAGELLLVVDGEQALRETMAASLTEHGYQVLVTGTSTEALAWLRREADPVQLLITGWNLPALPGKRFLDLVRAARPGIPVLITGDDAPLNPEPGEPRIIGVLPRPFRIETLLQRIRDLLERNRLAALAKPPEDPK